MKVAIVGCGLMGTCAARALALRGHEVTAFEQFEFGHTMGSSHGESRIVRKAYPDAFYTEILLEGYPLWHELQAETSTPILHEVGLLYFGGGEDPRIADQIAGLTSLGVKHEVRQPRDVPFVLSNDEVAVFTPEAGWVHPPTVLATARKTAEEHGAHFYQHKVESLGELTGFDRVVVTAGAWVRNFYPLDVAARQATFAYIKGLHEGSVFIEAHEGQVYGFPNEDGKNCFKLGCHDLLRVIDPDAERGGPDEEALDVIRDFCRRRMAIREPDVVEAATCLYTRTADDDFRIGEMDERTLIVSPCSGHGFKFGPWVGKTVADWSEGSADLDKYPRFAL